VDEDLFSALKKEFSEAQLVELTVAITWENQRARFDHAFGIESEGFSEGAFCAVPVRAHES
jgi:alkylhydroperoxidase family enzyme